MLERLRFAQIRTRDDGVIDFASPAMSALCDCAVRELEGRSLFDLFRFDHGDEPIVRAALHGEGEAVELPCELRQHEGSVRSVSLHLVPRTDAPGLEAVVRDVTACAEERARLREEVSRFRSVSELTTDCAYAFRVTPAGDLAFEWVTSSALQRVTGFTVEEIQARGGWSTLLHPDDLPVAEEQLAEVMQGNQSTVEYRVVDKDGSVRRVRDIARPIRDAGGARVVRVEGVLRDITERRRMERALAESRDRYRALFESANAAIFIADAETGALLDANHDAELLMRRSRAELIGMHQSELHPKAELGRYRQMFSKHVSLERVVSVEAEVARPDGSHVPVAIYGSHFDLDGRVYQIGVFHDLTEQKRAEVRRRKDDELRQAIIDHAAEGITLCHPVEGPPGVAFTIWNDRMVELTGYTLEEINRLGWFEALWPDAIRRERARAQVERLLGGEELIGQVHEVVRKDGSRRTFSFSASVLEGDGGKAQVLALISDLTDRERMLQQLRQSEKMEAVGQLAGGIAHDFNNQLAGIMGLADLMTRELSRADEGAGKSLERARQIVEICKRARDVTQQLLAFARRGRYRALPIDLHDMVHQIASILTHSIDKRIRLSVDSVPGLATVHGDPSQIQNALLNIALNARDAMPNGGELRFDVSVQPGSPDEEGPEAWAEVAVTDTGTGMSDATRQRVFEPFFTTKPQGKGTGMGLAAAYGTIKSHGGNVDVVSALGRGSTFRVLLPRHVPVHESLPPPVQQVHASMPGARILVVDDEAFVRETLAEILRQSGHDVTCCVDGEEAAQLYRTRWREIDLVVLDMVMPRRGGHDVFRDMLAINPKVQVLLVSGHSVDLEAREVLALGAAGFLQKPFSMDALVQMVGKILGSATLDRPPRP